MLVELTSLTLGKDATLNVNNAIKNIPAVNSNIKSSLLMSITSLQEDSEQSSESGYDEGKEMRILTIKRRNGSRRQKEMRLLPIIVFSEEGF